MRRVLIPSQTRFDVPYAGSVHLLEGLTMGTSWSVRLVTGNRHAVPALRDGVQRQLDAVVREMSHWDEDSDLGRFNRSPPGSWIALPDAFFEVLSYALNVAEDSSGAYDPAAGALVNLWGFGPGNHHRAPGFTAPDPAAVAALMESADRRRLEFDRSGRRLCQPGGVLLDLSAVAKGYGVDRAAAWLEAQGVRHYLVEVGGELRGAGLKPDGQPWWVALEQPGGSEAAGADDGGILLALHGLAVATSGDYRRAFERDGNRYSHTLDPRTGYPIRNGVVSVTVIHPRCMAADALSTALTVLGPEKGMCFAEARCLAARFLVRQGERLVEFATSGFLEMLE